MRQPLCILLSIILFLAVITTACIDTADEPTVSFETTPLASVEPSVEPTAQFESTIIKTVELGNDGDTAYYYVLDKETGCTLFLDDGEPRVLEVFVKPYEDSDNVNYLNCIQQFDFCGDWIVMTVGHYEGSGHYFYGYFVRMKKDGSESLRFNFTGSDCFVVVDNYFIADNWAIEYHDEKQYGLYRIRPEDVDTYWFDVENKGEYIDFLREIYTYNEDDGYIYGTQGTGIGVNNWNELANFVRCRPDGSEMTTYFHGLDLPINDESDYAGYWLDEITDSNITFTAYVHGYSAGDSWRGHNQYEGQYTVNKDGSNLILIEETYY